MKCRFVFLAVGNADSIVVLTAERRAVVIDVPKHRVACKWLIEQGVSDLDSIYLTHDHCDHAPTLNDLALFLEDWMKSGRIKLVYLPNEAIPRACKDLQNQGKSEQKKLLLRHALDRIDLWESDGSVHFEYAQGNLTTPHSYGDLRFYILHPDVVFRDMHLAAHPGSLNEVSVVIRVEFGGFKAILLSDLEGQGITRLLKVCREADLKAQLVKIPHHGAWPKNSPDLESLLKAIDAEIAVLSVGSTNQYSHVYPELFKLLRDIQADSKKYLRKFLCTEVTKTCMLSTTERTNLGRSGLSETKPCAGTIEILADDSGSWEIQDETAHASVVASIPYAACSERADL